MHTIQQNQRAPQGALNSSRLTAQAQNPGRKGWPSARPACVKKLLAVWMDFCKSALESRHPRKEKGPASLAQAPPPSPQQQALPHRSRTGRTQHWTLPRPGHHQGEPTEWREKRWRGRKREGKSGCTVSR
ncbi:uncharacterized protein LOC128322985 isoform X2 [Hemicordylus capensis]|uniref:uncharacterized protein LOC128322985 isoform X2 n=1 Tax=Hemicordylus capensis TaxID=884348 RepID=UPI0023031D4E|nr:uncharacterized protein LOC128322985 isoform X2 [Hemicordylus capensis]